MKKNVVKNIILLYGLSIAKLVFPLLTLPYLTRVLSTEGYGVVAYVKSVMQYMQLFVDFGFMLSGTRDIVAAAGDKRKIGRITGDILLARLLLGLASFLVLLAMMAALPMLRAYKLYTLLAFGSVLLSVFLFDYLFRGMEQMQVITLRFVVMKGISTALTFAFVRSDADILWVPILDILGSLAAVVLVALEVKKMGIPLRFGGVKSALAKLKSAAVYFTSNMATTVFGALNTIVIGAALSASDVAYWSVCMQLIGAVQTLYNPISDGLYPEMVKSRDFALIRRTMRIFMPIVLLGSVFCIVAAKYILVIISGAQYAAAAVTFRCLVPVLVFSFPAIVFGWPALGAIGKEKSVLQTTIITAVFHLAGLLLLAVIGGLDLISIALLRSATELILLLTRGYHLLRNRAAFLAERKNG